MENELKTLRKFLQAAMADENYETARQYMYLIEYLEGKGEGEDEDEMED